MDEKEFEAVSKLSGSKRYEYFIKKVVDNEKVWGLYNEGWAMVADDSGNEMIPFWPKKEFAEAYCSNEWSDYNAEEIDLDEFMDEWLVGMKKDGLLAAIFCVEGDNGVAVTPDTLKNDLNDELENY